ncbi:putative aminotransferase [Aulographum hederae CBS 113979]|uniref:Putative aminotransferase n=1 Tax=Aulographum hederae CBS 113979 TaxID=1176131 RepID=A0A6G1HAQ8_9PEZI|nr:putative aminotransferase [Aulographum hederae CBS 113979]
MSAQMLSSWISSQRLQTPLLPPSTRPFTTNLEAALDARRKTHSCVNLRHKSPSSIDFSSNDVLSLASSGLIRMAFFDELAKWPGFKLGSQGPRLLDGNNEYIELVEAEIASFEKAETATIVNSGYEANGVIFSSLPQKGDVIVFDELVHASVHDGMKHSLATAKLSFRHNNLEDYRATLLSVKEKYPQIADGTSTVIVSVESVYSMDGDIGPLAQFITIGKSLFHEHHNIEFFVDEAHSTGVLGPRGAGLVVELGLEDEVAVRLHTCGKAMGGNGAFILSSKTVKNCFINYARAVIYTTAPSFPTLASIRAGITLMSSGMTEARQAHIQTLTRHFAKSLFANPTFQKAKEAGILSLPVLDHWEQKPYLTHIIPIWTRANYNHFLVFHLQLAGICTWAIDYPVVPRGKGRVRLVFHAGNTVEEVEGLVGAVVGWAGEMVGIEEEVKVGGKMRVPEAARRVEGEGEENVKKEEVNGKGNGLPAPGAQNNGTNGDVKMAEIIDVKEVHESGNIGVVEKRASVDGVVV